jgi:methylmalonyl-CoA mutase
MKNFITKDFEPGSSEAWKQKIQFDLKGADYNKTLLSKTNEGIVIKPFYHANEFEKLLIPHNNNDFLICEKIEVNNIEKAFLNAKQALINGANAIKFVAYKPFDFENLLGKLHNKNCEFHFELHFLSQSFVENISEFLKAETHFLNIDIIGNLAQTGNWYTTMQDDLAIANKMLELSNATGVFGVNTALYHNAGANAVQEIAYALAHANEYFTFFKPQCAAKIQFNFAIGTHYFFEIAKFRAFKYLYNLILQSYNSTANAIIFAEPGLRNKTILDYNVNLLRTTTETMSAVLGGANTVANCAYNATFEESNEFGQRIARNQLHILKEESYFKNAQNIPNNSYYIESITVQLAQKALKLFKEIESTGGFLHQLKQGTIQRKISENAKKEQDQFNANELILLGTNKYPNKTEILNSNLFKSLSKKRIGKKTLISPILPKRLAEEFEQKTLKNET